MSVAGMLNQTIYIRNASGFDSYGRRTTGSQTTVKARVQMNTKRKLLPNNDVIVVDAVAYVPADTTVSDNDRITYASSEYKVFAKYPVPGMDGRTHHIKLELVKAQTA